MFCRAAKCFSRLQPIPLFTNSSELFLYSNPCRTRLIHNLRGRAQLGTCQVCVIFQQKCLLKKNINSIPAISCQRFSSWVNENRDEKEENNDVTEDGRKNEEGADLSVKSINGSVILADFKNKIDSDQISTMSVEDWSNLENGILSENPRLKSSWEAICMSFLKRTKSTELSFSLVNYIESQGRTLNIATRTAQIYLIGELGGPERHQQVLNLYHKLLEHTGGILDSYSVKNVLRGLCGTEHWKESFKLLEMLELSHPTLTKYFTPMVLAALREGDELTAVMLLNQLGKANAKPEPEVYTAFLTSCLSSTHLNVDVLLDLMGKYRWFPLRETLFEIVHHLKRDGNPDRWNEAWVRINKHGICPSCHESLMKTELTYREFRKLQSTFLEKTLIGDDIYQRSNPVELENFKKFVEKHAPFDVVIDSLNVACKMTQHGKSFQLRKVVEFFAQERRMKVLVIGRKHMKQWRQTDMNAILDHASCFFLENISQDDPYLLYATLYSGPKTMFVSSDEMRDHKCLLGEKLGEVFAKWQRSRQVQFLRISKFGKVILEWPRKENVKAQFKSAWHIPYDNGEEKPSWQDPFTWLCLKQSIYDNNLYKFVPTKESG